MSLCLRPNRDSVLNDVNADLHRILEEEIQAAKERAVARLTEKVQRQLAALGPSWEVEGDPEVVATELVDAALHRDGEPMVNAWQVENTFANGSLGIRRKDLETAVESVIQTLTQATVNLPECRVERGPFTSRVNVILTHFGTNFPQVTGVDEVRELVAQAMVRWALARDTGGTTDTISFREDADDTVTITVEL